MDISEIDTDALLDELRNRFIGFTFAGLYQQELWNEPDGAGLYVSHGGIVVCLGLCQIMERTVMKRRTRFANDEEGEA